MLFNCFPASRGSEVKKGLNFPNSTHQVPNFAIRSLCHSRYPIVTSHRHHVSFALCIALVMIVIRKKSGTYLRANEIMDSPVLANHYEMRIFGGERIPVLHSTPNNCRTWSKSTSSKSLRKWFNSVIGQNLDAQFIFNFVVSGRAHLTTSLRTSLRTRLIFACRVAFFSRDTHIISLCDLPQISSTVEGMFSFAWLWYSLPVVGTTLVALLRILWTGLQLCLPELALLQLREVPMSRHACAS